MITSAGARVDFMPVSGRWSADVPIPEAEQVHANSTAPSRRGTLFLTARLRVFVYGQNRFAYKLAGPNIRQNGTIGAYRLDRDITPAVAADVYPRAWEALVAALNELAAYVRADADIAAAEIAAAGALP